MQWGIIFGIVSYTADLKGAYMHFFVSCSVDFIFGKKKTLSYVNPRLQQRW